MPGSSLDFGAVRRAFDRAANRQGDDWGLCGEVARRMAGRLDYVRIAPTRILDIGCGRSPGIAIAERYPGAMITGVDFSMGMAEAAGGAKSLLARLGRLLGMRAAGGVAHLVCGEACALPLADASVDMVWSNLALPWAVDAAAAFRECHRVLRDGGLLMFSSYGPDTLRELKAAFIAADPLPHVHEFTDMHDIGDMLVSGGFADPVMDMDKLVYTYGDVDSLIRDLRNSGQTNAMPARRRGLMGRAAWKSMIQAYPRRQEDGRIQATMEIVYGHAWKIGATPRESLSNKGVAAVRWYAHRDQKT